MVKVSKIGIVALAGGVLTLLALFLSWMEITITVYGVTNSISVNGFYAVGHEYQQTIVLIGTVAAVATGVLAATGENRTVVKVILMITGIAIVIAAALALGDINSFWTVAPPLEASASAGIGLYLAIVGGALVLISPALGR